MKLKMDKVHIKQDLERLFAGFRWNIKGFVDEDGNLYPVPEIPQLITGIFQEIAKRKIKEFARQNYRCETMQGGAREYPELALYGGRLGIRKVAIDIKPPAERAKTG